MFSSEELISISALQHVLFCERQYTLIYIEQAWEENRFTAEGEVLHERIYATPHESWVIKYNQGKELFPDEFLSNS